MCESSSTGHEALDRLWDVCKETFKSREVEKGAYKKAMDEISRLKIEAKSFSDQTEELQELRNKLPSLEVALQQSRLDVSTLTLQNHCLRKEIVNFKDRIDNLNALNASLEHRAGEAIRKAEMEIQERTKEVETKLQRAMIASAKAKDDALARQEAQFNQKLVAVESEVSSVRKKYEKQLLQLEERNMDLSIANRELDRKVKVDIYPKKPLATGSKDNMSLNGSGNDTYN